MMKRVIVLGLIMCGAVAFARPQTLAEAAKKEKERREAFQGRTPVVVTNADLEKTKKKPAVTAVEESAKTETARPANPPSPVPAGATAKAVAMTPVKDPAAEARKEAEARRTELLSKWETAKERLDLLNLKMLALRQQFFTFNSMAPKDQIQKEIAATSLKLQEAAAEEAKLKKELDAVSSQAQRK